MKRISDALSAERIARARSVFIARLRNDLWQSRHKPL